jgi:hypothetical protein
MRGIGEKNDNFGKETKFSAQRVDNEVVGRIIPSGTLPD